MFAYHEINIIHGFKVNTFSNDIAPSMNSTVKDVPTLGALSLAQKIIL